MTHCLILLSFVLLIALLDAKEIPFIAHRGNSSEAPENTLASFQSAVNAASSFLECDIHLTQDRVPVIIHDRYLCRTANVPFPISIDELSLEKVKSLDAGGWFSQRFTGEKILTLNELLHAPLNEIGLMLEIKCGSADDDTLAWEVVKEVMRYQSTCRTRKILVGCLKPQILRSVKLYNPDQALISIIEGLEDLAEHRKIHPKYYALISRIATRPLIDQLHLENAEVWVWTVDDEEEVDRMIAASADGIITNRPNALRKRYRYTERD